jgi:hypothetical protein
MIDIQQFMNAQQEGKENAVKRTPIPAGEYRAVVEDVTLESIQGKKDPAKVYLKCNVTYNLDDNGLRTQLKRDKVTITDGFLVDLTDSGSIDYSEDRNIRLGRLRRATGLNAPGQPWSFPMFKGRPLMVKVGHEMYDGEPQAKVFNTNALG